ncbi:MAG: hypothetical protein JSS02_16710 [Planctomycetes bacterium]|nr:hypothetical protein [Planctomycetota bacterium]
MRQLLRIGLSDVVIVCVLTIGSLAIEAVAIGQDKNAVPVEMQIKVFHLAQVEAQQTKSNLLELFDEKIRETSTTIVADDRTNSLIIRGQPEFLLMLEALVEKLDREGQPRVPAGKGGGAGADAGGGGMSGASDADLMLGSRRPSNPPPVLNFDDATVRQIERLRQAIAEETGDSEVPQAELRKLKAELRTQVEANFRARERWQLDQLTEIRRRLDEIEKNVNARRKRANEIIDRRVADLLDSERRGHETGPWKKPRAAVMGPSRGDGVPNGQATGTGTPPVVGKTFANDSPADLAPITAESVWQTDVKIAKAKHRRSKRPLVIFVYRKNDLANGALPELLTNDEVLKSIHGNCLALKLDFDSAAGTEFYQLFESQNSAGFGTVRIPCVGIVTQEDEVFGPYYDLSAAAVPEFLVKLHEIYEAVGLPARQPSAAVGQELESQGHNSARPAASISDIDSATDDSLTVTPFTQGDSSSAGLDVKPGRSRGPRALTEFADPRKEVLLAENALKSAQAALEEAQIAAAATAAEFQNLEQLYEKGVLPQQKMLEGRRNAQLKAKALERARVELSSQERLVKLMRENFAAHVKLAELDLKGALSRQERAQYERKRISELVENHAISESEARLSQEMFQQATLAVERAQAIVDLYKEFLKTELQEKSPSSP